MPAIDRALICSGPQTRVRTLAARGGHPTDYGPLDRAAVLSRIKEQLDRIVRQGGPVWPGDGLRPAS
ncbi:hypothetical protein [Streptomyces sp. NPDC020681]|uniref:hypothetical protein n=1 Tax=Streptomyces sp. NPDC020681 TaxID=3365083 RepID=UPI00379678CB